MMFVFLWLEHFSASSELKDTKNSFLDFNNTVFQKPFCDPFFRGLALWQGQRKKSPPNESPGSKSSTSSWDRHIPRPSRRIVACYWHLAKKATFAVP